MAAKLLLIQIVFFQEFGPEFCGGAGMSGRREMRIRSGLQFDTLLTDLFNKGYAVNFVQRGRAAEYFFYS